MSKRTLLVVTLASSAMCAVACTAGYHAQAEAQSAIETVQSVDVPPARIEEQSPQSEAEENPLLRGLTTAEQRVFQAFREQCPADTGVKLFWDSQHRSIVMDVDYLPAEHAGKCLRALDGKVISVGQRPVVELPLEETNLPVITVDASQMETMKQIAVRLEKTYGQGPGEIAYTTIQNDALRIGVRTIPYHCWQGISLPQDADVYPYRVVSQEIKDTIIDARNQGIPMSLEHTFIDPTWHNCELNGNSCDLPAVGC